MKRAVLAVFSLMALCSLLMSMQIGPVKAYKAGYESTNYGGITEPTMDGKWTTTTEWDDVYAGVYNGSFHFRNKWFFTDSVFEYFLIEIFNDNTNDTGDYWQMCIDGDASGGSAPQAGDIRIDYVGHKTLNVYAGTGSGWAASATTGVQVVDSLDSSKLSATTHWICEIKIDKLALSMAIDDWIRVAVYDASTTTLTAWPPTPRDVPDTYGLNHAELTTIPEGLGLGVMMLLSTFAVLVGYYGIRRRSNRKL